MFLDKILIVTVMFLLLLFVWMFFAPYHLYSTGYAFFELFGFKGGYNNFGLGSPPATPG